MTEDIYRVKDEVLRMVYDHEWGGYEKGVKAERERIIKVIEDSFGNMTAEVMIQRIKEGTK
jgi:hypothetical protein